MKQLNSVCLCFALFTLAACSDKADPKWERDLTPAEMTKGVTPEPVTLFSRADTDDYVKATYSFRYLTRDNVELTRNAWEILYTSEYHYVGDSRELSKQDTFTDVGGGLNAIFNLGEKSCEDIESNAPTLRKTDPLRWLKESKEANPLGLAGSNEVVVERGHCYLSINNDRDSRVIALFHVKDHKLGKWVVIDEIEVLENSTIQSD